MLLLVLLSAVLAAHGRIPEDSPRQKEQRKAAALASLTEKERATFETMSQGGLDADAVRNHIMAEKPAADVDSLMKALYPDHGKPQPAAAAAKRPAKENRPNINRKRKRTTTSDTAGRRAKPAADKRARASTKGAAPSATSARGSPRYKRQAPAKPAGSPKSTKLKPKPKPKPKPKAQSPQGPVKPGHAKPNQQPSKPALKQPVASTSHQPSPKREKRSRPASQQRVRTTSPTPEGSSAGSGSAPSSSSSPSSGSSTTNSNAPPGKPKPTNKKAKKVVKKAAKAASSTTEQSGDGWPELTADQIHAQEMARAARPPQQRVVLTPQDLSQLGRASPHKPIAVELAVDVDGELLTTEPLDLGDGLAEAVAVRQEMDLDAAEARVSRPEESAVAVELGVFEVGELELETGGSAAAA